MSNSFTLWELSTIVMRIVDKGWSWTLNMSNAKCAGSKTATCELSSQAFRNKNCTIQTNESRKKSKKARISYLLINSTNHVQVIYKNSHSKLPVHIKTYYVGLSGEPIELFQGGGFLNHIDSVHSRRIYFFHNKIFYFWQMKLGAITSMSYDVYRLSHFVHFCVQLAQFIRDDSKLDWPEILRT